MRRLDVEVDEWLGRLLDEVDELGAAVAAVRAEPDAVATARDLAAVATLRLDGSPITRVPGPVPPPPAGTVTGPATGGWLEVLRSGTRELVTVPDDVLLAVEHRGARAGLDATDLAADLRATLPSALATLHARVTDGLLHPAVAGRHRRSEQAVHDASVGRVLFFPVDPAQLSRRLEELARWLATSEVHPVVRSGVLHHQVLDLHPYEAANGRLARIAARLLLAADGIDVDRLAQPEEALRTDPIGYLDEVGRSRRLGTPRAFVVRWAEALSDGLLAALSSAGVAGPEVPTSTVGFLAEQAGGGFTVVDHRDAVGGGPGADAALDLARRAGRARRVHGTRGLRWVAVDRPDTSGLAPG